MSGSTRDPAAAQLAVAGSRLFGMRWRLYEGSDYLELWTISPGEAGAVDGGDAAVTSVLVLRESQARELCAFLCDAFGCTDDAIEPDPDVLADPDLADDPSGQAAPDPDPRG